MNSWIGLLSLSYEELKARKDALAEMIIEPYKNITCSMLICDPRVATLIDLDTALAILQKARNKC